QQVETGHAHDQSDEDVDPPDPAVHDGMTGAQPRDELQRAGEADDGSKEKVHGEGGVADRVAGLVAMGKSPVPAQQLPPQRIPPIRRGDVGDEDPLTGDRHADPQPRGGSQPLVRGGAPSPSPRLRRSDYTHTSAPEERWNRRLLALDPPLAGG